MHAGRLFLVMVLGLSAWGVVAGCGDNKTSLYIMAWSSPPSDVLVGQTASLIVELSEAVKDVKYVDITNTYPKNVETEKTFLTFKPDRGADSKKQEAKFKGISDSGGPITLTFSIRDTNESRVLTFRVRGTALPDLGAGPDGYKTPDKGTPLEASVTKEQGPAVDKALSIDSK
jgi:hypothetical protein